MYDQYRGVISAVRVFNGVLSTGARLRFIQAGAVHDADEVGVRAPALTPIAELGPGEVGYLVAGIKDVSEARSGETVTEAGRPTTEPLMGYREPKPMVFCGLYPVDGDDYSDFRDALDRLRLNDSSFTFEPETSGVLGFGFRCGFLGPAAHGDRAGAPGAGVRPQPHRHRPVGGVPGPPGQRPDGRGRQPGRHAPAQQAQVDRGALPHPHHPPAVATTPAPSSTCARAGGAR